MDKKLFIEELSAELIRRGFDEKTVEAEMIPVDSYFDETGMSDITVSVKEMANEIAGMLNDRAKETAESEDGQSKSESSGQEEQPVSEKEIIPEEPGDIEDALLASGAELAVVSEKEPKPAGKTPAEEAVQPAATEETPAVSEPDPAAITEPETGVAGEASEPVKADETAQEPEIENIDDYAPEKPEDKAGKGSFVEKALLTLKEKLKKKPAEGEEYPAEKEEYGEDKNKTLFWVIFAVALPFVIALGLIVVALYIFFWLFLALLMIFIVAGLIVFVFGGTLISLIGIVYGIIVVIKGITPVGLYEIGLGITVGAAVMFFGILVYNLAIRLIPYGMKMLAKLFKLAFRRGKEGYLAFKRIVKTL